MRANLAYIDDVMDRAVENEAAAPAISPLDRDSASKKAKRVIAGFRVHDDGAEKKALDEMIEKRRKGIQKFRDDRATIRAKLHSLGVAPLAVCPSGAWYALCREARLFVLSPDINARVGIERQGFKDYSEKRIDQQTSEDWCAFLKRLFPEYRSLEHSDLKATLVLPDPPADVADVLCKAQSLKLTVAAIAEAIRFAEKPSELLKNANTNPKDLWAREQGYEDYQDWLKRDPIIFTEEGSATAIIAQFGDFPIERATVEAVVRSDNLISEKPAALEIATGSLTEMAYQQAMMQVYRQQREQQNQLGALAQQQYFFRR